MTASGEPAERPPLDASLSGSEFRRWYWLKRELDAFARAHGLSAAGGKAAVSARIAAWLDGEPMSVSVASRPRGQRLANSGELRRETPIPPGQRMTAEVRAFMERECGPGFRFDRHMRAFFARDDHRTFGDAADHWAATRGLPDPEIEPQFEYNRFVRAWRKAHPGATHAQVTEAWAVHRALPVDERPGID